MMNFTEEQCREILRCMDVAQSESLGPSREEAIGIIEKMVAVHPGLQTFIDEETCLPPDPPPEPRKPIREVIPSLEAHLKGIYNFQSVGLADDRLIAYFYRDTEFKLVSWCDWPVDVKVTGHERPLSALSGVPYSEMTSGEYSAWIRGASRPAPPGYRSDGDHLG